MSISNLANVTITGDVPVVNQKAYLRAVSRVNQSISEDPSGSIVEFEVLKDQINMTLDNNSEVGINKLAFYTYFITINVGVTGGTAQSVEIWVEQFDGSTWIPVEDSGRTFKVDPASEGKIVITGSLNVPPSAKFRVHARDITGAGTVNLASGTLSNGVTFPSAILNMIEN